MHPKRVAYLVMKNADNFVTDFHLSFEHMRALGWQIETVNWRRPQRWDDFDAVYICAPWDYPLHAEQFMSVLQDIDASSAILFNELDIVRWNLDKTYLRDIADRGHAIVPSIWCDTFCAAEVATWFVQHDACRLVIKPSIGANALDTYVLQRPLEESLIDKLRAVFAERAFLVQPFIENVQAEGEYSLFFFNGEYSHAILKTPEPGDFRVQEEHGANIVPVGPPIALRQVAAAVFADVDPIPIYGRGDWVRGPDGRYLLMELELVEPSLYLRTDSGAAARFARAFDQRFEELSGK